MPRNEITDAVRSLRKRLGDTQQQFANRLGLAISTVVRYELSRAPRGQALAQLAKTAADNECPEEAQIFRDALGEELHFPTLTSVSYIGLSPENPREEEVVQAVLWALRSSNGRFSRRSEASLLKGYRRYKDEIEIALGEALVRFNEIGGRPGIAPMESVEATAKKFALPGDHVRLWFAIHRSIGGDVVTLRKILYRMSFGASSTWLATHFHIPIETAVALQKVCSELFPAITGTHRRRRGS